MKYVFFCDVRPTERSFALASAKREDGGAGGTGSAHVATPTTGRTGFGGARARGWWCRGVRDRDQDGDLPWGIDQGDYGVKPKWWNSHRFHECDSDSRR